MLSRAFHPVNFHIHTLVYELNTKIRKIKDKGSIHIKLSLRKLFKKFRKITRIYLQRRIFLLKLHDIVEIYGLLLMHFRIHSSKQIKSQ